MTRKEGDFLKASAIFNGLLLKSLNETFSVFLFKGSMFRNWLVLKRTKKLRASSFKTIVMFYKSKSIAFIENPSTHFVRVYLNKYSFNKKNKSNLQLVC